MLFSLVMGTLNRSHCIKYCLESLQNQVYKNFEVIIIDQSDDDQTEKILQMFESLNIIYKRVLYRGLSRARNEAIRLAKGDYICLVDDDAYYSKDYLSMIEKHIQVDDKTIISGYIWNAQDKREFVNYKKIKNDKDLSYRQVIRYCPSPAISFPKEIIIKAGYFDEEFGVGAKYGAGEETDFLLRAMRYGFNVKYFSDVKAMHPHENIPLQTQQFNKKCSYNFGIGAMYEKQFHLGNFNKVLVSFFETIIKLNIKCLLLRKSEYTEEKIAFLQGKKEYKKRHY